LILSHAEIKTVLPHRYPMLLVDAVRSIEPGESIVAIKNVTGNEPCFAGLSDLVEPYGYAYPRSLILESFGQAASIIYTLRRHEANDFGAVMLFGSARNCRFHGDVFPGDTLEHHARLERSLSDAAIFAGEVWVDDRRVVEVGQFIVAIRQPAAP
jgi:3-hydroxyacyl-[acyl-carrier-protein] dehydratase